jgi:hypothetical protein
MSIAVYREKKTRKVIKTQYQLKKERKNGGKK